MKENEKLWRVFNFDPYEVTEVGQELYVSTTDKSRTRFFLPKERDPYMLTKEDTKKERVWRNSRLDKARTQLMNKQRRFVAGTEQLDLVHGRVVSFNSCLLAFQR